MLGRDRRDAKRWRAACWLLSLGVRSALRVSAPSVTIQASFQQMVFALLTAHAHVQNATNIIC